MSMAAAILILPLIAAVWFSGAMKKPVSHFPERHRHSMTLCSISLCHRQKPVTWYFFTVPTVPERM